MHYSEICELFQTSESVRLFRSDHAPLILAFFSGLSREDKVLVLTESDLIERLYNFLEYIDFLEVSDSHENTQLSYFESKAGQLIKRWTDQGYLRNDLDLQGTVLYELTPESEKALQWLDTLQKREFVGTESRMKDIINRLRDLVENTNANPDVRLHELALKKAKIEQEMARIQQNQEVHTFDDYQIKSRFQEVNRLAQQLLSDFREVEGNFRELTRDIYHRHMELRGGKGQILRYAFDALEALKSTDQGKSFYAFWDFLLVTSGQEELQQLTEKVFGLLDDRSIEPQDAFLKHLRTYLHQAAQKVLESNDRMAERLSRIIVDKDPHESRKMKETFSRIKELAVRLADLEFSDEAFFEIDLRPHIFLPMERRLSLEPQEFMDMELPELEPDDYEESPEVLEYLFNAFYVDKDQLRERVERMLDENPGVSLTDLVRDHPVQQGLPEIFAYLHMSARREGVDEKNTRLIPFDYENKRALRMPEVRFHKP